MKIKLLALIVIVVINFKAKTQVTGYTVGQTVVDFSVVDTDWNVHTLSDYTNAGKWVVLNFFNNPSPPSSSQITTPIFNDLYEKYGCNTADLVCIALTTSTNDPGVILYMDTYGGASEHCPAISHEGFSAGVDTMFIPNGYPTFCLIGPDRKLKIVDIWPISAVSDFESAFASASFNPTPATCSSSISDDYAFQNMKIYPNPADENTTLSFDLLSFHKIDVQIHNMIGKNILSFVFNGTEGNNEFNIKTSNLSIGEYLVRLGINGSLSNPIILNVVR